MSFGIRGKLFIGLGAFLLLFVGAGVVGWSNTIFFSTSFNALFENHLLPESRLTATQQGLYELRLITSVYVAADRKTRATLRADDAKRRQQVDDNMAFYGRGSLSPSQREALGTWKTEYASYLDSREVGLHQAETGSNFDAADTFNQRADPSFGRVIAALDTLASLEAAEAGTLNAVVSDAADLSRKLLGGALALVIVLGMGVAMVVSRSEGFERQLRQLAFRDSLTGLPNRALFGERLAQALARGNRHDRPVAVLFLDLDGFKAVNDTLGHQVGDALLCEVATRLRSCLRAEDTAARLGGDEFTILLGDHADEAIAQQVADRITQAMEVPMHLHGRPVGISASIGIGISCPHEDSPESLLRRADLAMYEAKELVAGLRNRQRPAA